MQGKLAAAPSLLQQARCCCTPRLPRAPGTARGWEESAGTSVGTHPHRLIPSTASPSSPGPHRGLRQGLLPALPRAHPASPARQPPARGGRAADRSLHAGARRLGLPRARRSSVLRSAPAGSEAGAGAGCLHLHLQGGWQRGEGSPQPSRRSPKGRAPRWRRLQRRRTRARGLRTLLRQRRGLAHSGSRG